MKKTRQKTRCKRRFAALAMSLAMVLSSFSGLQVYAEEDGQEANAESFEDGFYRDPGLSSASYISWDSGDSVSYAGDYTVYFAYRKQEGEDAISVTEAYLNSSEKEDGETEFVYTVGLDSTGESGITFTTVTTDYTDYIVCKLTIPGELDIYNANVGGFWLSLNRRKGGLVRCACGDIDWDTYKLPDTITQECISDDSIEISEYDFGEAFFGYATLDSDNNTVYTPVTDNLTIQKKTGDGEWIDASTDGYIKKRENTASEGCYQYGFYKTGTYGITYTDGETVDRIVVNVTNLDMGYVTDLKDIQNSYIAKNDYDTQEFMCNTDKSFYFVFNAHDGDRVLSTDDSGNALMYRWDDELQCDKAVTVKGVTVEKCEDIDEYAVYKVTIGDSYDFDEAFSLHTIYTYTDWNGEEVTDESGAWISITLGESGLGLVYPPDDVNGEYHYDETAYANKIAYYRVKTEESSYFVNSSDEGRTICDSELEIQTVDGTKITDASVATIKKDTDKLGDRDGLYDVRFNKAGTYRIVDPTDGSFVIAVVRMPDAALYTSTDITEENLLGDDPYTYTEGKAELYLAISKKTEGYTLEFDKDYVMKQGNLKEYGLDFELVSDGEDYLIYKLVMPVGFLEYDHWIDLRLKHNSDDGNNYEDWVILYSKCEISGGSLVVSGDLPEDEYPEGEEWNHYKTMGLGGRESWIYLANTVVNKTTGELSYVPVQNVSDITITRWSGEGTSLPTIEETDEEGYFKLTFGVDEDETDGYYLATVGSSSVLLEKGKEIIRLYKENSDGGFTHSDDYDLVNILNTKKSGTTFYAYYRKESMGSDNEFHYFFVRNEESGEYYYFEDLQHEDNVDTDWNEEKITMADTENPVVSVDVSVSSENKEDWLFKITVNDNAPANLYLSAGMEVDVDPSEGSVWVDRKELLATTVTAEVEDGSATLDSDVDDGQVTVSDVPSVEGLSLLKNMQNEGELTKNDTKNAKDVKVSIKTGLLDVDKDYKVATDSEDAEALQSAVDAILDKRDEALNKNYSATFLDLSVNANITRSDEENSTVTVPISESKEKFEIKVPIPNDLKKEKGFSIIRYHKDKDGKESTDRLVPTVEYENGEPSYLTFKSDKFSTYALAYRSDTALDKLDFSNAAWSSADNTIFAYDGKAKTVTPTITGLPEGCTYTLKGTAQTEAGSYKVYVDTITYNGDTYDASDAELPATIAKGYGWTILAEGMSISGDVVSETPDDTSDKKDDTSDKKEDTSDKKEDTSDKKEDTSNKTVDTSNKNDNSSNSTDTTTVKKGTTTKNGGNTYTVTNVKSKTVAFTSVKKNSKTVKIPSKVTINGTSYKVTSVAANAFKNNKKLTKVTIPSSVTKIEASAFSGCTKLTSVSISKNVTSIGKSAFSGCTSLKSVTLPTKLTTIGANAFSGCKKLKSVTIPKNVKSIGTQAFYNCSALKKITIKTTKLTSKNVGSKAFKGINAKATIKVPKSKLKAYKKLLKSKGVGTKAKIKK